MFDIDLESWVKIGGSGKAYGFRSSALFKCKMPDFHSGGGLGQKSDECLITSVVLRNSATVIPYYSSEFDLSRMFFEDFSDFQLSFSYARGRHKDSETVKFIAKNNISSNKCHSPSIWVTSFSIYCYKSLGLGGVDLSIVEDKFQKVLSVVNDFASEEKKVNSARTNVYSRLISIYCAYVHVLVYEGQFKRARYILKDFFSEYDASSLFPHGYNLSRLLCFKLSLEDKSFDTAFYKYYARGILRVKDNQISSMSHMALKEFSEVAFVLSRILSMAEKSRLSKSQKKLLLNAANRSTGPYFSERIKEHF